MVCPQVAYIYAPRLDSVAGHPVITPPCAFIPLSCCFPSPPARRKFEHLLSFTFMGWLGYFLRAARVEFSTEAREQASPVLLGRACLSPLVPSRG